MVVFPAPRIPSREILAGPPRAGGGAKKVSIQSLDAPFPAHADGEFICLDGNHLTLELLPQELEIIHA